MTRSRPSPQSSIAALAAALFTLATIGATACSGPYEFNAIELGRDDATRAPRPKSNSQFLRAAYADILGRAPAVYDFVVTDGSGKTVASVPIDEQTMLLDALDGIGDPDPMRAIVVAGMVQSSEAALPAKADAQASAFVVDQFHRYLGREPTAYELAAFVAAWNEDAAVGPRVVVRALVGSREYQSD